MNIFWVSYIFLFHHRGYNDGISGFNDDGWSLLESDGMDDVVLAANSTKKLGTRASSDNAFALAGGVICAKASMLLKVSSGLLVLLYLSCDLTSLSIILSVVILCLI